MDKAKGRGGIPNSRVESVRRRHHHGADSHPGHVHNTGLYQVTAREQRIELGMDGVRAAGNIVLCGLFLWKDQLKVIALPPHLSHLKDVHDRLPDPDRQATAPVSLQTDRSPPTAQPLHGAEPAPSVILHKPPEAQDLDQHRGHQHEEQGQARPQEVLLVVIVDGQPQIGAHVPEEDQQRQDDPQAVQPEALLRRWPRRISPFPLRPEVMQAGAPAAPVARRGVAAVADVEGAAVARVVLSRPHHLVQVVQLGETGDDPATIGFRCHLSLWCSHLLRLPGFVTTLPWHLFCTPNVGAI